MSKVMPEWFWLLIFIPGGDIPTALPPCQRAQGQLEADGWSNCHVWWGPPILSKPLLWRGSKIIHVFAMYSKCNKNSINEVIISIFCFRNAPCHLSLFQICTTPLNSTLSTVTLPLQYVQVSLINPKIITTYEKAYKSWPLMLTFTSKKADKLQILN